MEYYCRQGQNVLLIAPKNVMDTSWNEYLPKYLGEYMAPYDNVIKRPMTFLGFDPQEQENDPEGIIKRRDMVRRLADRTQVIVIDESHNFRSTSADRYNNLYEIVGPQRGKRKKVILLTATPINTAYRDLSAQMALVTHDQGNIGGYRIDQIKGITSHLDKEARSQEEVAHLQFSLHLDTTGIDDLGRILESVIIQRSRKTCKELSEAAGKPLRFPSAKPRNVLSIKLGSKVIGIVI